jgi:hypothetical protein
MDVTIPNRRVTLTFDNGPKAHCLARHTFFLMWRTHSCVPRSHSCERQLLLCTP